MKHAKIKPILSNNKGFSLIETVLTLSLIAVLAVAAIPTNNAFESITLDSASRKILTDIRYAQNLATTTLDTQGFRITGTTTYEVYDVTTNTVVTNPFTSELLQYDLSDDFKGVTFSSTGQDIQFNSYGNPVTGGGTNISIEAGESSKTISVSNASGFISLN